jgi:hypothetical protein
MQSGLYHSIVFYATQNCTAHYIVKTMLYYGAACFSEINIADETIHETREENSGTFTSGSQKNALRLI